MILEFSSRLLQVRQESSEAKTFRFSCPAEFSFRPGQYINLYLPVDDHQLSISSSPNSRYIEITKKITDHPFSQALAKLPVGAEVKIKGPYGLFILDEKENAIMLAGGIGVTPLMSMIRHATENKIEKRITLFYSNKTEQDIAFRKELEELSKKNNNPRVVETITQGTWHGQADRRSENVHLSGRIDENMVKEYSDLAGIFYISGPPAMVEAMTQIVKNIGVPDERIKTEKFLGY